MVGADGRVRVVDFGLARAVEAVTTTITTGTRSPAQGAGLLDSDLTIAGTVLGTPGYMAPEQFRAREADVRTDIFSFCVALYEALYGQRPFDGGSYDEIAASVTAGRLAAPPEGARVPAWLRRVLARGLARDPDDRWPSLDALLAALADDPIARRRRRIKRSIAGLALLALVIGAPLCFQTMFDRWRADARERSAADRWELVSARIDVLARSGREREAEAAFAAYTAAPEHQGTRALSRAWLERGRQRYRAGALEQATHAFASAYTEAPTPALERETLLAMGGLFRERGDFDALAPLVVMLEEPASESRAEVDPELDTLRLDDALHAHDFARARALVDRLGDDAAPRHAGLRPLLDRLTRATAVAAMDGTVEFIDLDGDGQGEYVGLPFTFEALRVLRVDGTARAEHPLPRGVHHAILVRGAPYLLLQTGTETRLYRFDLEALRERWRGVMAPNVAAAVVGDVDRDGAYELYVGLKDVGRTLLRLRLPADDDAPIEPPEELVAATASARSDVAALRIADLDGDGHDALIASFGAWRTYDVRVLRPRGDALEITARRETGNVNALCVLRRPDGALRIAVAKDDLWANRRVFPEPPHTGPSAGVYLLDPEGPSLAVASYTPITLSPRAAPQLRLHKLECADLDGDGRDELLVSAAPRSVHDDLASTVLLRSGVGDELHALRLEGLRNPVIAEIDGATPYLMFVLKG